MISWKREPYGALMGSAAFAVLAAILSGVLWDKLPDPMPLHWDARGQADGFGPRWLGASLGPAMILGAPLLVWVLSRIDPRRGAITRSRGALGVVLGALASFFLALHGIILRAAMTQDMALDAASLLIAVGALLMVVGNIMPKFGANFFIGARTPWALSDDVIWLKTQRLSARLLIAVGVSAIAVALAGLSRSLPALLMVNLGALAAALIPAIYSYALWRQRSTTAG